MKDKFINWAEVCLWAVKDCTDCLQEIKTCAEKYLSTVQWHDSLMKRSGSLKHAWLGFCEERNIEINANYDSAYLGMKLPEALNYFINHAANAEGATIKYEESYIISKIQEINSRKITNSPRILASCASMEEVSQFFASTKYIDSVSLELCHKTLESCNKFETLAYLEACYIGNEQELYFDMPSDLLSKMAGKPCKTRDLEKLALKKEPFNPRKMFGTPTLLVSDEMGSIHLISRNLGIIKTMENCGSLLTVIPTSSTLEQFVICCNAQSGECTLVSTTRKTLEVIGQCSIEKPTAENIEWMDCIVDNKNRIILYWGGLDALRGQITWNHYSGVNIDALHESAENFFYDVGDVNNEIISEQMLLENKQDFSKHGNVLTLWSQMLDNEDKEGKRIWNQVQSIVAAKRVLLHEIELPKVSIFVWGSHIQFLSFQSSGFQIIEHGKLKADCKLPITNCASAVVLYAHSR
jgi:hypothetical protein